MDGYLTDNPVLTDREASGQGEEVSKYPIGLVGLISHDLGSTLALRLSDHSNRSAGLHVV